MDFNKIIEPLSYDNLPPEFITSLLALVIILIITLVINIKLKKYNPLERPKGFLHLVEIAIDFADRQVTSLMGDAFEGFGGYLLVVCGYIFLGFFIGMIGIPNFFQINSSWAFEALPNPFTNMAMPLSIALITFCLTHYTSIRCKKWSYFKRFTEPFVVFAPINLVTMWSSLLSLTLRLFGNALAGYCVITLIYVGIGSAIPNSWYGLFISPIIAPIAHLYFDMFDGFIQLMVFGMLTMINISGEYATKAELLEEKKEKKALKLEKKQKRLARKEKAQ